MKKHRFSHLLLICLGIALSVRLLRKYGMTTLWRMGSYE